MLIDGSDVFTKYHQKPTIIKDKNISYLNAQR